MPPIISIKNLRKSYGSKEVLKGINLDIYPGQVIGYIGPNGAGKSTTVKILCGLLSDYTGEVMIKDMDLKTNTLQIKSLIGYVPELAELYDVLTPSEFLSFMGALYNLPAETIKDRVQKFLSALGLKDVIDQRMDTFSKGMKQKVLIASGLLHNPEIVILDEPLSGLDANSVLIVKDLIQRLAQEGKTIFYCSHMMDIVEKVSDQIVLIDQGVIVANGSLAELKTQLGDKSLEQMFASLTVHGSLSGATDEIMDAMNN
ncbi:MAG TPA: ABC transporter ATP-binding protein [Saprospiraceae bacterium]|nr:ABC transporter ATP-binding protein [Saprospiraceae bacterium]